MNNLIRKPAPAPTKPFESSTDDAVVAAPVNAEKKKVEGNVSIKVSPSTRATLNAVKDFKSAKNVDELINEMLQKELATFDAATQKAIEIIAKSKM